ncbi:hypothetical protein [Desulforamulus aeronauticus]|uniref:Stage III sporulation protein AG n=1 Tax=Desulforamulus aeronauticus DSM 10349 TaxID=1121421 RepID=A0A1M6PGC0_9FIRM|nr:hypothetical protein [Desulforamulus aeronauticus]SHK06940.1 stage III sporulation protein AG [Desulforamulus aeronauticus DSM 10349]
MSFLKNLFGAPGSDGPHKEQAKKLKWLAATALIGICLLFAGGLGKDNAAKVPTPEKEHAVAKQERQTTEQKAMATEEDYLAEKVCKMLEEVEGAGKVKVTVRLDTSTQTEYAINTSTGKKTTQEKDQSGGTRVLTEDTDTGQLVLVTRNGEETPVMSREIAPNVAGVLVVAEGASDPEVKARLFRATQVALGVESHKVIVMARKAGE